MGIVVGYIGWERDYRVTWIFGEQECQALLVNIKRFWTELDLLD